MVKVRAVRGGLDEHRERGLLLLGIEHVAGVDDDGGPAIFFFLLQTMVSNLVVCL